MGKKIKKLTVIIPFYHESFLRVKRGIILVSKYLDDRKINYEIIVSQNGPKRNLSLKRKSVKIIYDLKSGLGLAIKNAIKHARGNYTYIVSPEMPFNFTDLDLMLKNSYKYDLIVGSKLHPKSIYKINKIRFALSHFFSLLTQTLLPSFTVRDPNGTLFGDTFYLKKFCKEVKSNDFFMPIELMYLYLKNHHKILEVPVTYINKKKKLGSSVKTLDGWNYLLKLLRLSLSRY